MMSYPQTGVDGNGVDQCGGELAVSCVHVILCTANIRVITVDSIQFLD